MKWQKDSVIQNTYLSTENGPAVVLGCRVAVKVDAVSPKACHRVQPSHTQSWRCVHAAKGFTEPRDHVTGELV